MQTILLWIFVIVLGIELGAGLYETFVVMPLWTQAIPDSVVAYVQHNIANPQFALNPGGRFWIVNTPLVGLTSIAALISAFWTRPEHRKWRIAATVLALIVVISTFAWFIPNIIKLSSKAVLTMDREEVASIANAWVTLNWFRAVIYSLAWLAGLRALSIPSRSD